MGLHRIDLELPPGPISPRVAREALSAVDPNPVVLLVASELVTHAVRYGAPPIRLAATSIDGSVRLEVCDRGPDWQWSGDMLARRIITRWSIDWGVDANPGGKCAWAIVAGDCDAPA